MLVILDRWRSHVRHFCMRHPNWRSKLTLLEMLHLCKATYIQNELERSCDEGGEVEEVCAQLDYIINCWGKA